MTDNQEGVEQVKRTRQVRIKDDDERLGLKAGEVYKAEPYRLDPSDKWTLLARVPDGHDPMCNAYRSQVEVIR